MHYVFHCLDKTGAKDVRTSNRDAHLAYLSSFEKRILVAGPLLDEAGAMTGSLLILDFDSLEDARAFAQNDPYAQAGLFASVTVTAWKKVYPR